MSSPAAAPASARLSSTTTKLKLPGASVLGATSAGSAVAKRAGYGSGGSSASASGATSARLSSGSGSASGEVKKTVSSSASTSSLHRKAAPSQSLSQTTGSVGLAAGLAAAAAAAGTASPIGSPAPVKKRPSTASSSRPGAAGAPSSSPSTPRVTGAAAAAGGRVVRGSPSSSLLHGTPSSASSSRRPSVSLLPPHMRSPSAAASLGGGHSFGHGSLPGHGHSNSMTLPAQDAALTQLQIQVQALQSALEHKSAALARAEDEVSNLRLATSASEQQTQLHALQNKLKNLESVLQAQREGAEGALGFAPGHTNASGRQSSFGIAAAREKKFEETVQDLQWQLLYGDTPKDLQAAKAQDQLLELQRQREHDQAEIARLSAEQARRSEQRIEQWLIKDAFTAVL